MVKDRYIPPFFLDNPLRSLISSPRKIVSRFSDHLRDDYTVLDLGSGPGFFTVVLSKIVSNGIIYAVDPDPKAVSKVKEKVKKLDLKNVVPYVSPAQKLDFLGDKSIDFIFSNLMLCCTVDHEGALKEMKRVLKDGGLMYLSVSRSFSKGDRLSVNEKEWREILNSFKVIREGRSLMELWALVKNEC